MEKAAYLMAAKKQKMKDWGLNNLFQDTPIVTSRQVFDYLSLSWFFFFFFPFFFVCVLIGFIGSEGCKTSTNLM